MVGEMFMPYCWPSVPRPLVILIMLGLLMLSALLPAARGQVAASNSGSPMVLRLSDEAGTTPPLLEPALAPDPMILGMIFGGLVSLDAGLRVVPEGADRWTVSADGTLYTFHIRPNLRMGDGSTVTASDFAWSLNRALTPQFATGPAWYYLNAIQGSADARNKKVAWVRGIQAPRPDTLRITLARPSGMFLQQLAFPTSYVTPQALIQRWGDRWTDHAVGTGPFRLESAHRGSIVLIPNPYYWRGPLALHELDITLTDAEGAYALYRTGKLDVMGAVAFPSARLPQAQAMKPDYHAQDLLVTDYLAPNVKRPPFNNPKVRRAFAYATDRRSLTRTTLGDRALAATGILPPGLPGFDPSPHGQTFNPALARTLLASAGYPGGRGLPPITLALDGASGDDRRQAVALQQMWQSVLGVTVRLSAVKAAPGAYTDALAAQPYQLAFNQWSADYPDPQNFLSLQLQTGVTNNLGGYSNAQVDRLTARADTLPWSDPQRVKLYQQAEKIALDDVAWIVLDWQRSAILIRSTVHGLAVNGNGIMAPDWTKVMVR